jgi:diacylglycerol kinase family enzyme
MGPSAADQPATGTERSAFVQDTSPYRAPGKVQIVFNSAAGRYAERRLKLLASAFERRGLAVSLQGTSLHEGISIDPEAELVCAFGGDGTARMVASAMIAARSKASLCVYPGGTINLLAREAGYVAEPDLFADRALEGGRQAPGYALRLGAGHCVACASVGPDAFAVEALSLGLKRRIGRLAYVAALARLLFSWPRAAIRLDVDGRPIDCEAFFIAKGRFYAGPWSFAPSASLSTDTAEIVALKRARRRDFLAFALTVALKRPVEGLANVVVTRGRRISASAGAALPLQADGDIVARLPVTLEIDRRCLRYA